MTKNVKQRIGSQRKIIRQTNLIHKESKNTSPKGLFFQKFYPQFC